MRRIIGLLVCISAVFFVVACTQTKEIGGGVAEETVNIIVAQNMEEEFSNEPILEFSQVGESKKNNNNYAKYTKCEVSDEYIQLSIETDVNPSHVVHQIYGTNGEPLDPSLEYVDFGVAGNKVGIMYHRNKEIEGDNISFLLMNEDCPTIVKVNVDLRGY